MKRPLSSHLAFWSCVALLVGASGLPLASPSEPVVNEILQAIVPSIHTSLFD